MPFPAGQGAEFSPDRVHRYWLWRTLDAGVRRIAFIGLNPSVADEVQDDRTVSRCMKFAKQWGYSRFDMLNAFAFVATEPDRMLASADPVGPENDEWLRRITGEADFVIAAWGDDGARRGREDQILKVLDGVQLHHLGLTVKGHPFHPLRLPGGVVPKEWR